ncbi:MAG: hypothetical protein JNN00_13855 [Chitinophagaceae bacterium]|nr:hypothetical protein [Chitinophagaceae bacterium]
MVTMFGGALLSIKFLPKGDAISIISAIFIMLLAFFLQRFTSTALVEVTLTKNDISIRWLSQYIFHHYPDRTILFSDIESYKYQPDNNFDLLKLTMKDGSEVKLWHFALTFKDDFDKLVMDLPQLVNIFNKRVTSKSHSHADTPQADNEPQTIKQAATIYEGDGAIFIAIFAVIVIIAVPLILYFNPDDKKKNPFILLAPMAGAIFFLTQFYRYRKKNKTKP